MLNPFGTQAVNEVSLAGAPLALVLAQVRHPSLTVYQGSEGNDLARRLAHQLASDYPIFAESQEKELILSPQGITENPSTNRIWRLRSADEKWRVSFSSQFVALDTSKYEGRRDFCDRFERLCQIYAEVVRPPSVQRLGLRYVNRVENEDFLEHLDRYVVSEVLGPLAIDLPDGMRWQHALTQFIVQGTENLKVQWGVLPPGAIMDFEVQPASKTSWILDIDAFTATAGAFDAGELSASIRLLAENAYRFFRWSVKSDFLKYFDEAT